MTTNDLPPIPPNTAAVEPVPDSMASHGHAAGENAVREGVDAKRLRPNDTAREFSYSSISGPCSRATPTLKGWGLRREQKVRVLASSRKQVAANTRTQCLRGLQQLAGSLFAGHIREHILFADPRAHPRAEVSLF